jgi:tetratricopeptide (TPR) repeat protein
MNQACELYKYALGLLRAAPPETVGRQELIAHILKNVGMIRCSQGDISIGSQLMHESMELFSADDNIENINVAEVWYELGEAYMLQQWKEDSIFEHVMRLVQEELGEEIHMGDDDDDIPDNASIDSDCSDGAASYSVCAHEAMGCYKSALAILSRLRRKKEIHTSIYVDVLTKLGDCSIIVGEYERAVLCYEEALYLCQNTLGSVSLTNSAHILSMLGTTNFLLGTYSKAATMYETANILQQHLYGLEDNFEMAFTMSMLGNTYYMMRQYHKCIAWCIKAFELYVNIYKQEIIFVDSLHRWFIAHTLYCLGFVYSHLNFHDKALHNLDLAKNMIEKSPNGEVDVHQHVKILKVMADVYANTEQNETALVCYQEALDLSLTLGDEQNATTLHNQLLNRMAGIHVNTKQYDTAAEYLEQVRCIKCFKYFIGKMYCFNIFICKWEGVMYVLTWSLGFLYMHIISIGSMVSAGQGYHTSTPTDLA